MSKLSVCVCMRYLFSFTDSKDQSSNLCIWVLHWRFVLVAFPKIKNKRVFVLYSPIFLNENVFLFWFCFCFFLSFLLFDMLCLVYFLNHFHFQLFTAFPCNILFFFFSLIVIKLKIYVFTLKSCFFFQSLFKLRTVFTGPLVLFWNCMTFVVCLMLVNKANFSFKQITQFFSILRKAKKKSEIKKKKINFLIFFMS